MASMAFRRKEMILEVHEQTMRYWDNTPEGKEPPLYFILNNVFICKKGDKQKVLDEQNRTPSDILFPRG
jgi:hypothetical protein